ncbi:hypothetical protein ETH_00011115 [Eimeria tenella]|uniref:Uncharacterized protein n=1 Tax=Eimeria tenella TaxID=5802 RepID=U6KV95_EIMTE|nr:hypothetical protein ETH_00011115 [Eimeria tenella]CDJ42042.1 hypothetical protein ETH_00011115 [Eimeria tenella]|eukprot:XP_013232792.1 hypothetical protein ETH_00011115 [Eimeria tenella]
MQKGKAAQETAKEGKGPKRQTDSHCLKMRVQGSLLPSSSSSSSSGHVRPPLARLASLLCSTGALSTDTAAAAVLSSQQQQQLQHELQQLLLRHLAAAQEQGRAVAAPLDAAGEMVERTEVLSELHERLRGTAAAAPPSLFSRLSTLLLSKEQQPLQRPHAILRVLLLLSRAPELQQQSVGQKMPAAAAEAATTGRGRQTPRAASTPRGGFVSSSSNAAAAATAAAHPGAAAAAGDGDATSADSAQHLAMSLSHSGPPAARRLEPPVLQSQPACAYDLWGADEISLLRDLLFVLQGMEGRFVRFDPLLQTARLCAPVKASRSVLGLVARVGSLGCMYTRVKAAVEEPGGSFLLPRPLTAEAFRQSVAAELRQYFKLIAILEEDIARAEAATDPSAGAAAAAAAQGGLPTLRRLAVWLQGPYQRMRFLTEAAKGLKGAALLSTIYAHCSLGDSELRTVALQILHRSLLPMADAIESWTKYGHLRDEEGEFFIREAPQDPQMSSWRSRFVLVRENIPSFIPPLLPERLLLAGKSVLYSELLEKPPKAAANLQLQQQQQQRELPATLQELLSLEEQQQLLQSPQQQQEHQQLLPQRHDDHGLLTPQGQQQQQLLLLQQQDMLRQPHDPELPLLQKIDERVAAASTKGNQRQAATAAAALETQAAAELSKAAAGETDAATLVELLLWEHDLLSYLEAIRRFLLLADGDFTSLLLDAAAQQQQQQQHGGTISLQPLILSAIDTAARQCSSGVSLFAAAPALAFALTARFPHTSYLQQQCSSSSSSTCSALWRGLVLHLRIEEPLRFFIGDELLQQCHKLFALLWKSSCGSSSAQQQQQQQPQSAESLPPHQQQQGKVSSPAPLQQHGKSC